mgnify:CR=1 FL=1
MTLAAFTAAWFLHLIAAASPGPAVLMAARTGVSEGFRTGAWLAVGIGIGAVFWAVILGITLLNAALAVVVFGRSRCTPSIGSVRR